MITESAKSLIVSSNFFYLKYHFDDFLQVSPFLIYDNLMIKDIVIFMQMYLKREECNMNQINGYVLVRFNVLHASKLNDMSNS